MNVVVYEQPIEVCFYIFNDMKQVVYQDELMIKGQKIYDKLKCGGMKIEIDGRHP